MKKYGIRENTREVGYRERKAIKEGCTLDQDNQDPEILEEFDILDDAREALGKYEGDIRELSGGAGTYYLITEYYIEENEYDEDGEYVNGGDVWGFAKLAEGHTWEV